MTETERTELTAAQSRRLREQLEAAEAKLDSEVTDRLGEARMAALAASTQRSRPRLLVPLESLLLWQWQLCWVIKLFVHTVIRVS